MSEYIRYLLVAAIVVYIIDLSGFTQSWKGYISSKFGGRCKVGKPFDCSLCMTWWSCLIVALCLGELTLPLAAYIAALSLFADILGQIIMIIKEATKMVLRYLYKFTQL